MEATSSASRRWSTYQPTPRPTMNMTTSTSRIENCNLGLIGSCGMAGHLGRRRFCGRVGDPGVRLAWIRIAGRRTTQQRQCLLRKGIRGSPTVEPDVTGRIAAVQLIGKPVMVDVPPNGQAYDQHD